MHNTQDTLTKAWFFASQAHRDQKFPGSDMPYLTHIGNVMMEVQAVSPTLEQGNLAILCAILHDTIEDTEVSYEDIVHEFSVEVADGVMALTKDDTLPSKQEKMLDSLQRIQQQPKEIWVVKMADRTANLGKPPHYWSLEKITAYHREAQMILEHLGSANMMMAQRLAEKIESYRQYTA
ncbi:MAG TPA: bifunctional (p)ppGpp synthetase/guanosine-3',5'-bis(diphosphate) 3'-pyrophosphohydrolase [Campylobacterales bacterium]|nr:bifunctional (p)ppGpp synthetase/guanosine-3',5'-bis(diphosphate) 3'-pyrophosphohydrolase [Campylobacterales bacterium]